MPGHEPEGPFPGIEFLRAALDGPSGKQEVDPATAADGDLLVVDAEAVLSADDATSALLTLDVSGAAGEDGRDGLSYAGRSAARASRGRDGEDAGLPQPGRDAGGMEIELRSGPAGSLSVRGRLVLDDGRTASIDQSVPILAVGHVQLIADGGPGGSGGSGGDGEGGGRGRDGADASRYRSGDDGGPGGDGGDGGIGSSGQRGGNGGQLVVQVDHQDTHLLMLVAQRALPGRGGQSGSNGSGGPGGPGGSGGSSYSWTTTDTESYRDAQGHMQTRTVTHHHRNPGGWDGSPGHSGRDGQADLHPGPNGQPGSFSILVHRDGQWERYPRCFDLELLDYEVVLADRFAEPTSPIALRNLTVRNSGGMPTPETQAIFLRLPASGWIEPQGEPLHLPRPLAAGESYTFGEAVLQARIADLAAVPVGEPLRVDAETDPQAWQSGIERRYPHFRLPRSVPIAFPCEIESVESLATQTPGQAALFRVTLRSTSTQVLGRHSATRRQLHVRVRLTNRERAEDLMLLDLRGRVIAWDAGWHDEVPRLEPEGSVTLQAIIGLLPGAPGYSHADLQVELEIGRAEQPDSPRACHRRQFRVRVGQAYQYDPEAEILFVASHATTGEERAAWEAVAARLGKRMNIWDVSLEDDFTLSERRRHGDSLLRDFHGKTVAISNAVFETVLGLRRSEQFVGQRDLIRALEAHRIRLLLVDEQDSDEPPLTGQRLIPTDGVIEHRYRSISEYLQRSELGELDALVAEVEELEQRGARAARPDPLEQTAEIPLYGYFAPNVKRLRRQAMQLQRKLESRAPGKRYLVTYALPAEGTGEPSEGVDTAGERLADAAVSERQGWFFHRQYQGTLTVMPTAGDAEPNLVVVEAEAGSLHDPSFIAGVAARAGLIQALDFRVKVDLLDLHLRELETAGPRSAAQRAEDEELGRILVDAILADLAAEQRAILRFGWKPGSFGKKLDAGMAKHRDLAEYPFRLVDSREGQAGMELAARLVAGLEFLGHTAGPWYDAGWWPWSFRRRAPSLRQRVRRSASAVRANLFGSGKRESADRLVGEQRQLLAKRYRELRSQPSGRGALPWQVFHEPLARLGIRTGVRGEVPRVMAWNEWRAVQQAELQREAEREALKQARQEKRGELLVAQGGAIVEGQSEEVRLAARAFASACAAWAKPLSFRERATAAAGENRSEVAPQREGTMETEPR